MSLREKLLNNSTIKETAILTKSKIFGKKDMIITPVPFINVALSGRVDGGITPGMTMIAGPSKHFKTSFALLMASSFLAKYDDALILFYDNEFGTPESYVNSFGIDPEKIVHTPITNIEQLKFDIIAQLEGLDRKDKVLILIDSVGNLASKKEIEDAKDQKSVADMSRAKQLKSLWRMVTPYLTIKDIPLFAINHTYKSQDMYPTDTVSGGTGGIYSADNIWIVGRSKDKDGKDVVGYHFNIKVEKSRFVKENSVIPITVTYDRGIARWSGMLENAMEAGYVSKPKPGWYCLIDKDTGEVLSKNYREDEISGNGEIWKKLLKETALAQFIRDKYSLPIGQQMIMPDDNDTIDDIESDSEDLES